VTEPEPEGVGTRAASGVLWLTAQKWAVRVSGFVTLIILTRQISPQQFGVVAAAMTVIPMVYLLSDLGFSTYLLQADTIDQETSSTAFWASAAAGAVLSGALAGAAPLMAAAFEIPELESVLRTLVLAIVPTVLGAVPLALLRRAMNFRAVAFQSLIAALLAQVVAVVAALADAGVWALVAQVIVTQWVTMLLAWHGARWRPSLQLSIPQFRYMTLFGLRVSSVDLVATSRIWAEGWIISVTLGTVAFGLLNIAQRLVQVAQELTAASLVPVSTVVFARVRDSRERLRATYLKALGVSYGVVSPIMVLVVVLAPVLVPLMFGDEWTRSAIPSRALAIAGIITLGAMLDHGLFYGLSRPGTWLVYSIVVDSATVGMTAFTVRWGLVGVAVGFVVVAAAATFARWLLVATLLGVPSAAVASPFRRVMLPTALTMIFGVFAMEFVSGRTDGRLVVLVSVGVLTGLMEVVLLRLLAGTVVRDALSLLPLPARWTCRVERLMLFDVSAGPRVPASSDPLR